ncbi:hypothetical protein GCM10025783_27110 [Amnibacterium soli]|uniref:Resolvase/invertase-type recombinase catalytic domain-containing protein n=1 Tax=Amnibacterium soli TaxID=1282736 RepID=A0ABP8ZCA0_9MICO
MQPTRASSSSSQSVDSSASLLAAARKVYVSYIHVSSKISQDSGRGVERLKPYLTADAFQRQRASVDSVAKRNIRTVGDPELIAFEAQSREASSGGLSAYACVDFSRVRVKTSSGKDVTPVSRPDRQTSVPIFVLENGRLVLSKDGVWSGESIC